MNTNSKKPIAVSIDKLNRTIDLFREAFKDNDDIYDAFGYFKCIMNEDLDYPDSPEIIRIALERL